MEIKQKLKAISKRPTIFYPLLFAAFPILFLYAYNISETLISQIWLPLAISVIASLVLWIILSLILRSLAKAGFATVIFLVFFFSYGRLYEVLENWGIFVPSHASLLPSVLLIWGCCTCFISLTKRDFRITTKMLNIIAVVLIAINLFNIASYEIKLTRLNAEHTTANPMEPGILPDIYFILLDEYAHPDTMKEWYDYDNSHFINSLEDKGFFIASESKTRTLHSPQAIAQRLNMEYLTPGWYWNEEKRDYVEIVAAESDYPGDPPWSEPVFRKMAYSKAADFLKTRGYQYIYFGNWGDIGRWDSYMEDNADLHINYYKSDGSSLVTEFGYILWNTTMLRPFYHYIAGSQYENYHRRGVLGTLEHLKKVPDIEGPKFVFVDFACPHSPYVFGPNGGHIAPANWANYEDKQFYLGQYIFISVEIEKVIDALLDKSETPPIIILQSDHGQRPHQPDIVIGADEWEKIFNAMYLPGMDADMLDNNISPVNTFRLIFNHYFGSDYPLLEND